MLLYTKIIYNINSLLYNYISAPFLFYIFFARLLKFVEAFFFSEFCWKSILFPVSRPKPLNSPRGSLRTLSLRFKILGRILRRKWTRFSRTSSLRIQTKAIIIMILLPQARLNNIFSSHQYDTNESRSRINKKTFFQVFHEAMNILSKLGVWSILLDIGCCSRWLKETKKTFEIFLRFITSRRGTKIRKLLSLYHQWRQSNRPQWLCSANYTIIDFTRERGGSLVDLGGAPKSRKWRRAHGYANAV